METINPRHAEMARKVIRDYSFERTEDYFSFVSLICTDIERFLGGVEGKKILDIGCGASKSAYKGIRYEPHNSRFLAYAGADVTGIDAYESIEEPFNHLVADLTRTKLTDLFKDKESFDVAISAFFFDSPTKYKKLRSLHRHREEKEDNYGFDRRICSEVHQILRKNGLFFLTLQDVVLKDSGKKQLRGILDDVGFIELEKMPDVKDSRYKRFLAIYKK